MRAKTLVIVALVLSFSALPAEAALIFSQSGTIRDISYYLDTDGNLGFELPRIGGPLTSTPPFSVPVSVSSSGPIWNYIGPTPHYTVKVTAPLPFIDAQWETYLAEYYFQYQIVGGVKTFDYQEDNSGGIAEFCPSTSCAKAVISGNTATFAFDGFENASGGSGSLYEYWTWYNGLHFVGTIPFDASDANIPYPELDGRYTLQIFATGIPEPATWAMLLVGFGGIGIAMRRRSVVSVAVRVIDN